VVTVSVPLEEALPLEADELPPLELLEVDEDDDDVDEPLLEDEPEPSLLLLPPPPQPASAR